MWKTFSLKSKTFKKERRERERRTEYLKLLEALSPGPTDRLNNEQLVCAPSWQKHTVGEGMTQRTRNRTCNSYSGKSTPGRPTGTQVASISSIMWNKQVYGDEDTI